MEIISSHTDHFGTFALGFAGFFMLLIGILMFIEGLKKYDGDIYTIFGTPMWMFGLFFMLLAVSGAGTQTHYMAKVTDWDYVDKQDEYEVVRKLEHVNKVELIKKEE